MADIARHQENTPCTKDSATAEAEANSCGDSMELLGKSFQSCVSHGQSGQRKILARLNAACGAEATVIVDHHRGFKVFCAEGEICASLRGVALQVCHASRKGGGRLVTHYSRGFHLYCSAINHHGLSLVVVAREDQVITDNTSRIGHKVELAATYLQSSLATAGFVDMEHDDPAQHPIDFTAIQAACDAEVAYSQLADGLLANTGSAFVAFCEPRKCHRRAFQLQALAMQSQLKSQLFNHFKEATNKAGRELPPESLDPRILTLLSQCCLEAQSRQSPISITRQSADLPLNADLTEHRAAMQHFQVGAWVTHPLFTTTDKDPKILGYVLWGDDDAQRASNNLMNFEALVYDISFTLQVFRRSDRGLWARLRDCWESFQYANL